MLSRLVTLDGFISLDGSMLLDFGCRWIAQATGLIRFTALDNMRVPSMFDGLWSDRVVENIGMIFLRAIKVLIKFSMMFPRGLLPLVLILLHHVPPSSIDSILLPTVLLMDEQDCEIFDRILQW